MSLSTQQLDDDAITLMKHTPRSTAARSRNSTIGSVYRAPKSACASTPDWGLRHGEDERRRSFQQFRHLARAVRRGRVLPKNTLGGDQGPHAHRFWFRRMEACVVDVPGPCERPGDSVKTSTSGGYKVGRMAYGTSTNLQEVGKPVTDNFRITRSARGRAQAQVEPDLFSSQRRRFGTCPGRRLHVRQSGCRLPEARRGHDRRPATSHRGRGTPSSSCRRTPRRMPMTTNTSSWALLQSGGLRRRRRQPGRRAALLVVEMAIRPWFGPWAARSAMSTAGCPRSRRRPSSRTKGGRTIALVDARPPLQNEVQAYVAP